MRSARLADPRQLPDDFLVAVFRRVDFVFRAVSEHTPGEYDCICTPEATGMIVHEAFGHGVEMDMFVKKRALAEQFVGKQVVVRCPCR